MKGCPLPTFLATAFLVHQYRMARHRALQAWVQVVMVHKNAINGELIMSAVGELHRSVSGEAS